MIQYVEGYVAYDNPKPHIHSRHGYFPGLARLKSGEIICLFVMAEAFEAPGATTYVTRSQDQGRTWTLQGALYDKSLQRVPTSDSLKPTVLRSGKVLATGYRFLQADPEGGIAIPETNGFRPGENITTSSDDGGLTWREPTVIQRTHPELIEASGPTIEISSGDLLAVGALSSFPTDQIPVEKKGS